MAKNDARKMLIEAAAQRKNPTPLEQIKHGETIWFHGCLVAADDLTFTLDLGGGQMVVIDHNDALTTERQDEGFMVEVAAGTNVVARMESVIKAGGEACDCAEEEAPARPAQEAAALQIGNNGPVRDPFNVLQYCWRVPKLVFVCRWIRIGRCQWRRICYLTTRWVWVCSGDRNGGVIF